MGPYAASELLCWTQFSCRPHLPFSAHVHELDSGERRRGCRSGSWAGRASVMTWTPQCSIRLDRAARLFYLDPMCGRFTQQLSWAEIHRLADLIGQPRNLAPRFNIAPTTPIEVVRAGEAGNELIPMRWGLVPSWWKKPLSELPSTFNARAETVTEKPMFRAAFNLKPRLSLVEGRRRRFWGRRRGSLRQLGRSAGGFPWRGGRLFRRC